MRQNWSIGKHYYNWEDTVFPCLKIWNRGTLFFCSCSNNQTDPEDQRDGLEMEGFEGEGFDEEGLKRDGLRDFLCFSLTKETFIFTVPPAMALLNYK